MSFLKALRESWCVMVEKEMKFLVDKETFELMLKRIEDVYPDAAKKEIIQINYYYDTADFELAKQNITLRVREIDNVFYLQTKQNKQTVDGIRFAEESEKALKNLPQNISGKDAELDTNKTYELLGKLVTKRKRFLLKNGTKIDCDINEYNGKTDYEIELEIESEVPEAFVSEFKCESCKHEGKYKRFVKEFKYEVNDL